MFCPKCGKQLPDNFKFCTSCGTQVGQIKMNGQQKGVKRPLTAYPPKQAGSDTFGIPQTSLSAQIEISQKTKETKNKNKRTMIILFIILIVLILVAAGMAVYYFKVLNGSEHTDDVQSELDNDNEEKAEKAEEIEEIEEVDKTQAVEESKNDSEVVGTVTSTSESEEEGVVSDTNEVVKDVILPNVPKALYSYDFEETLGNAQVVVRNEKETMPEAAPEITPQYVDGMDGKAVYLDGSYGIQLSDVSKIGTSYTIAFWMKADAVYDWAPFIHIGNDLLDSNRRCRLWLGQKTDGVSVAPILSSERGVTNDSYEIRPEDYAVNTIEPGMWYHIAFTVDGNVKGSRDGCLSGTLYVSGRYDGRGDVAIDTMNVNDFTVYLGINCWDDLYPVAFDDVKIWDQVLDGQQIAELFDAYQ